MKTRLQPCGTSAAYNRHRRYKQEPCAECRAAERARRRAFTIGLEPCTECGGDRNDRDSQGAHGWCCACYHRWLRAGRPPEGPPPPPSARREDYLWLRDQRMPVEDAAARVGVKADTAIRWERRARKAVDLLEAVPA